MRAWAPLMATTMLLVFAGPAAADTVSEPQVITDQATETEPAPVEEAPEPDASYDDDAADAPAADDGTPAPEPPPDASGRRGEIHVLDATSASSPAAASPPAASAPAPAAPAARARTLPFTGPHAGVLALVGLALLAAGFALRRQLPQTF